MLTRVDHRRSLYNRTVVICPPSYLTKITLLFHLLPPLCNPCGRATMRKSHRGENYEEDMRRRYQKARQRREEIRRLRSDTEAATGSSKRSRNSSDTTSSSSPSSSSSSPQSSTTTKSAPSDSDGDVPDHVGPTCVSHGSASLIGRRREMEDAVTVLPQIAPRHDFFGVYDGHGGAQVAAACRERMHVVLGDVAGGYWPEGDEGRWREVMGECFARVDEEVSSEAAAENAKAAEKTVGSTAVVAVVGPSQIVVANCGDSRAVLSRGGVAVPLSEDHKPDRPDEMERVEAAGGRVINWGGYRVLGVLATSRSIGDYYLKPYVTAEPEVTVTNRTDEDEFLILASDGLWDVISNEVACKITRKCLSGQAARIFPEAIRGSSASEAAAFLAELAMSRGSGDNISVVVVQLKRLNSESTSNENS